MNKLVGLVLVIAACGGSDNSHRRLRTAIDAQQSTLDECYERTLRRDADAKGTMRVLVHVPTNTDGQVDRVKIESTELANKKLQTCVRNTLLGLQMAKPPANDLTVQYTLKFAPVANAAKADDVEE